MKSIVVYTFSDTLDNYGQVLQYLATQTFFEKMGFQASILRHRGRKDDNSSTWNIHKVKDFLFRVRKRIGRRLPESDGQRRERFFAHAKKITTQEERKHPRHFEEFRDKYFKSTYYDNLLTCPPPADIYCVGSDQTWSWLGDDNFLNFGPSETKRISFSPSFGAFVPKHQDEWKMLSKRLERFNLVTCRERSGVEICQQAGIDQALLTPDPTLLLSAEQYSPFTDTSKPDRDFIFMYLLGNPVDLNLAEVYSFARKENLEVVYVTSQGRVDRYPKVAATIPQWLSFIKNAKYVITNSYHGVAMSILFERKFLSVPLIHPFERMNGRVSTLLENYALEDRIFVHDIEEIKCPVSFEAFHKRNNHERELLKHHLLMAINSTQ